jgi:hypothetical protein
MIKQILSFVSVLLLITSCDNTVKYKAELAEIDLYESKLDSLDDEINGIEFDSLVYMQAEADKNEKIIKTHYAPDTIDVIFAEKLNLNKGVRKSLKAVMKQKGDMLKEIDELKIQFKNLKTDIYEGIYDADQITDYLNVEKLDYNILYFSVIEFDLNQTKQKKGFYYANPQIAKYVEIIMNELETL